MPRGSQANQMTRYAPSSGASTQPARQPNRCGLEARTHLLVAQTSALVTRAGEAVNRLGRMAFGVQRVTACPLFEQYEFERAVRFALLVSTRASKRRLSQ
jgi:hypothetical protein